MKCPKAHIVTVFLLFVLTACQSNPPIAANSASRQAMPPPKPSFMLILDNSNSMAAMDSDGSSKMDSLTTVIADVFDKLPENTHKVSLFTYDGCQAKLLLSEHQQNFGVLTSQINDIKAHSDSPIAQTLLATQAHFSADNTILLISDGQDNCKGDPCAAVQQLQQNPQQKVTIHTVAYQADASSRQQLQCLATATGGHYAVADDAFQLETVVNELIRAKISQQVDGDGDGVANENDQCAHTPQGFSVDKNGCETYYTLKINFPSGSAEIQPQFEHTIKRLVNYLKTNQRNIQLQGHTDSNATALYNKSLSERRAQAVRDKLLAYGIAAERLSAVGFGEERPISRNKTPAGRYRNRRVEAHILP